MFTNFCVSLVFDLTCVLLDTAACYAAGMQTKIRGQISQVLSKCLAISWTQASARLLQLSVLLFLIIL